MSVAAKLHPKFIDPNDFAESFGPEKIRAALVKGNNVIVMDLRQNPFLFSPNPGAIWPEITLVTLFEERFPRWRVVAFQRVEVMLNFQKGVALATLIYDRVKRIGGSALRVDALKPGSIS